MSNNSYLTDQIKKLGGGYLINESTSNIDDIYIVIRLPNQDGVIFATEDDAIIWILKQKKLVKKDVTFKKFQKANKDAKVTYEELEQICFGRGKIMSNLREKTEKLVKAINNWDQDYADNVSDECAKDGRARTGMHCIHINGPCHDGDGDIIKGKRWHGKLIPLLQWRKEVLQVAEKYKVERWKPKT